MEKRAYFINFVHLTFGKNDEILLRTFYVGNNDTICDQIIIFANSDILFLSLPLFFQYLCGLLFCGRKKMNILQKNYINADNFSWAVQFLAFCKKKIRPFMCLHAVFRCAMCTYSRQMYKKDGILFCLHYNKMIFHFGVEKIASQSLDKNSIC